MGWPVSRNGAPTRIRISVSDLRGRRPWPLDDGGDAQSIRNLRTLNTGLVGLRPLGQAGAGARYFSNPTRYFAMTVPVSNGLCESWYLKVPAFVNL